MRPVMTVAELNAFLDREFPQIHRDGRVHSVVGVGPDEAQVRLEVTDAHLRPGGTVSGPTLFALADLTAYVAILAQIGPVALAVTTSVSINFLRKPPLAPLLARCRILKLGKRLAVAEIHIAPEGVDGDPVVQATATYSIPPHWR
jgi:uncharacterized protein (TIGR00369 family)